MNVSALTGGLQSGGAARSPLTAAIGAFRGAVLTAALLSLVINVLMLASPLFMLQVYDRVLTSRSMPTLAALTLLVAGIFGFAGLLEAVRLRLMVRLAAGFDAAVRDRAFEAVLDRAVMPRLAAEGQPLRDLEMLRHYLAGSGPTALFDLPWVPVYLALNYFLHPLLGHLTLAAGVLLLALALAAEAVTRRAAAEATRHSHRAHVLAEEARLGAEALRAMGLEPAYRERWGAEYERSQAPQMLASDRASALIAGSRMLRLFLQSASIALGAALAISGLVSAGAIVAGSIVMARALAPIEQATAQWTMLQGVRRAWNRLSAALLERLPLPNAMPLPAPQGYLQVENLAAAAPGAGKPIVSGVNFSLKPGDGLGVIGPSGSGKSTLARALVGVWPALSGGVRFDGALLEHWPRGQLGAAIGYLPQDVEIFSGSVQDNIARFAANPNPAAVVRAAKRANVHEMVLRLPEGYATELGEGGARLSAGQRQRLALARALYGDPVLLVLDEPNSNLDAEGEAALAAALAESRRQGVTVVLIAHRHLSLQSIDRLLYLRDGRQVAFGPREEVLNGALTPLAPHAPAQSPEQAPVLLTKPAPKNWPRSSATESG